MAAAQGDGWGGVEHVQTFLELLPGVGPILRHLIEVMPGVQAHKTQLMLDRLLDLAAMTSEELIERMHDDPRLQRLLWEAARAAADSELDEKIAALAAVAAQAVEDDATIDIAQIHVRTLAELQPLHVRTLVGLEAAQPGGDDVVSLVELLGITSGVASALVADLLRLGLVQTGGLTFTSVHTGAKLSDYGREVLSYLRHDRPN